MKKAIRKTLAMATISTTLFCTIGITAALAEEAEAPAGDASVTLLNQYIWRGFAFSDDSMVVQPSVSASYKGIGFNLWGNLDTDFVGDGSSSFNETDMTISYDGSFENIGYSVGYIYYGLDGIDDSQELYLGLSMDTILSPSLTFYKEITSLGGWYASLGISHSLAISETLGVDLGAQIGYLDDEEDYSEFHDALLSVAMPIALNDYLTVTPELYYSLALTGDSSDLLEAANLSAVGDADDSFIYGGVTVSMSF